MENAPMRAHAVLIVAACLSFGGAAKAASFIVPDDAEMVAKSDAIVTGTVEGSYVEEREELTETTYEIRIDAVLKGAAEAGQLLRVVSPGGSIGERGTLVPGAAHYAQGSRVLVFLTEHKGRWQTTDFTLGKFRFVTSTAGERLLVRDMEDVVGWDHAGRPHREIVRKADHFLRFVGERARGRAGVRDYEVEAEAVTLSSAEPRPIAVNAAPFPARTYTDFVNNQPIRWPNISAGVSFYKRSDQNIAGASDGGVQVIRNGLAAWTNECGSVINLVYAGSIAKASANHDGTNVVEYNDPQGRISGSWGGSGTVAITFISFAGSHTFLSESWLNITGADVVFQDGYTATHAAFPAAMTHELGHGIGWRHSNQDYATGGACNSAVEECTSAAIMNSSVSASYGYTLQPWDVHAAQSVYPGGSCGPSCTPPVITGQPVSGSVAYGQSTTLTVTATGTAPLAYQWYIGASGSTVSPISGANSASLVVRPYGSTQYWVRVSNGCGSVNSATATVNVAIPSSLTPTTNKSDVNLDGRADLLWRDLSSGATDFWLQNGATTIASSAIGFRGSTWTPYAGDFDGDGRADFLWRNTATGQNEMWFMSGLSVRSTASMITIAPAWTIVDVGDFNGDGRADIFWRATDGRNLIWLMVGADPVQSAFLPIVGLTWSAVAVTDFDGDGRADILFRQQSTGQNLMWLIDGTKIKNASGAGVMASTYELAGAGDFNGDGFSDLLWHERSTGRTSIWLMRGPRFLTGGPSALMPGEAQAVAVADFNADGREDVVWRRASISHTAIWFMNGLSIGSAATTQPIGSSWSVAAPAPF